MQVVDWSIAEVVDAQPALYLDHCAVMAVACMCRDARSPCSFVVQCENFRPEILQGDARFEARISWDNRIEAIAWRLLRTEQARPIIERGAVAIAALSFARLIPDGVMRVTRAGERADYWLPRLRCALEISGTGRDREVGRRHREKVAQVLSNPRGWDGYVFVCCFDDANRSIRWSYHTQEEQ